VNRLIRLLDVQSALIRVGIDRDSLDAELPAGSHNTNSDLAAIGNQYFFEH
jgi:hypothetical protein